MRSLNGIFRCAHSVKGGAATFGFADVAELTHQMESLLDRLRRHELLPNSEMVDVLLESADASRSLLARHQAGGEGDALPTGDLVRRISELASGTVPQAAVASQPVAVVENRNHCRFGCCKAPAKATGKAHPLTWKYGLDHWSARSRRMRCKSCFSDIPGWEAFASLALRYEEYALFAVETGSTDEDLLDLFAFHVSRDYIQIRKTIRRRKVRVRARQPCLILMPVQVPSLPPMILAAGAPLAPFPGFGFFDGAPGAPVERGSEPMR